MNTFSIPPLFDHHSHYSMYATLSTMPTLADINDHKTARDIIRGSKTGAVTIILGWNSSRYALTPADLGEDKPVIVLNLSLHGMVMNKSAREYLSAEYRDIVMNHTDPVWTEKNLSDILALMVKLTPTSAENMASFGISLRQMGIGAMEDMLLPGHGWLESAPDFPIPVYFWADQRVFGALTPGERENIKGVKLFTDGALGTRTAALSAPYLSGENGTLLMENDAFTSRLYNYMRDQIPVAVHAIGDRAVSQVVESAAVLRREAGCGGPVRIEHAQFISRDAAFKARESGIVLSMQPNFSYDSVMYTDRLPYGFPALNNPFRMLIDDAGFVPGTDLILGSDGMPHGIQPALQNALFPPFPGQALTLPEFKAAYCLPDSDYQLRFKIEGNSVVFL